MLSPHCLEEILLQSNDNDDKLGKNNSLIWTGKVSSGTFSNQSNVIIIYPYLVYSIRRIEFWSPSKAIWEKYKDIVVEVYWEEKSQPEKSFALSKDFPSCI